MRYRVQLPSPKAKRLKTRKVFLQIESAWGPSGGSVPAHELKGVGSEDTSFEFEVDDNVESVLNTTRIDGRTFRVWVEFTNETGSRKEKYQLVPEPVMEPTKAIFRKNSFSENCFTQSNVTCI